MPACRRQPTPPTAAPAAGPARPASALQEGRPKPEPGPQSRRQPTPPIPAAQLPATASRPEQQQARHSVPPAGLPAAAAPSAGAPSAGARPQLAQTSSKPLPPLAGQPASTVLSQATQQPQPPQDASPSPASAAPASIVGSSAQRSIPRPMAPARLAAGTPPVAPGGVISPPLAPAPQSTVRPAPQRPPGILDLDWERMERKRLKKDLKSAIKWVAN